VENWVQKTSCYLNVVKLSFLQCSSQGYDRSILFLVTDKITHRFNLLILLWSKQFFITSCNFSRNNQLYALICTTPLFYVLASTCFGSSLPSSGIFLDPSEILEIQLEWVVYHIMCGYVACVPECCGSVGTTTLPDDGRLLPKHVGASI
jgi:hypothetical protein